MPPIDDIDRTRLEREARERRAARRGHPGAEPSDPPASSDLLTKAERHARWWDAIKKIGAGVAFALGVLGLVVGWALSHAANAMFERISARIDPLCILPEPKPPGDLSPKPPTLLDRFTEITVKQNKTDERLNAPLDPKTDIGTRLDRLDTILEKALGDSTKATAPPTVGPTAKHQGRQ